MAMSQNGALRKYYQAFLAGKSPEEAIKIFFEERDRINKEWSKKKQ